ncbi:hypothetical protein DFH29DRAFT_998128 [Suillus ampliporus]|nr:hypothetical protein DFH29DRAFT_998128 [Suillus ampliporus]
MVDSGVEDPSTSMPGSSGSAPQPARTSAGGNGGNSGSSFPSGGSTLGLAPALRVPTGPAPAQSQHPESVIELIMELGVLHEVAISMLDAADGDVNAAANVLFLVLESGKEKRH